MKHIVAWTIGDAGGECPEALLPAGYVRMPAAHRLGLAGVCWPRMGAAVAS